MVGGELRIGRISGIEITLHWSLLIVFALVTWSLATESLPLLDPTSGPVAYWIAAAVAAVLLFVCLLAHELGHALVARRGGLSVDGITLWIFGGVASLKGETNDPRAEFRVAAVGPLVSFAIGGLFEGIGLGLRALGAPALVVAVPQWLAVMNVVLAVFNLIPAFPLDGGRVLRAWLWRRRKDRVAATRIAAATGRGFGYLLIGLGLLMFMTVDPVDGMWFVFLGWFLLGAARSEESRSQLSTALADVRVFQVMTAQPLVVPAHLTAQEFIDHSLSYPFSAFPVIGDDHRVLGLVTLTRIKGLPADARATTTLDQITVPLSDVPIVAPHDTGLTLLERIRSTNDRRALVFDGYYLVGIVSPRDLHRMLELVALR